MRYRQRKKDGAAAEKKIPARYLVIFAAAAGALFLLQNTQGTIAGSKVDWISQHTALADYFRKRFYETHSLFPQFAAELGGGQNIYNFAYYGLYDPLYLLSWLFPFIPMETWFQIVGVAIHTADGILCFVWLKRHAGERESAAGAFMLMLSAAVSYHSYVQVMFVNYLPFFLLMLIGTDVRRETGKGAALTVGTVGVILTSFYFAPACMAALGIWILTGTEKKGQPFPKYVKALCRQAVPALLGIALSMFYLLPVFCALTAGRDGGGGMPWREFFLPDINAEKYLYSPYGLGCTAMAAVILWTWICAGKCRERMMAVLLTVIFALPVFSWLLNGGLYARSKVFLPFLPLISFLGAGFFERLGAQKTGAFQGKTAAAGYAAGAAALILGSVNGSGREEQFLIAADLLLCGAGILLTIRRKRNQDRRRYSPAALLTVCTMFAVCTAEVWGAGDLRVSRQEAAELYDPDRLEAVVSALAHEKHAVRMEVRGSSSYEKANQNRVLAVGQNLTTCYSSFENGAYTKFRESIGLARPTRNCLMQDAQDNPLFLRFMGVKYLIGQDAVPGWECVQGQSPSAVYKNGKAAPMFYLTAQTMPAAVFEKLPWQEKQIRLLEAAAVPEKGRESSGTFSEKMTERKAAIQKKQDENGAVAPDGDSVRITAKKEITAALSLDQESQNGDYVFLSFRVKNYRPGKDVSVTAGGVKNKLSSRNTEYYNGNEVFHYTLVLPEGTQELAVRFGAGDYEISEITCCVGQVDEVKNESLYENTAELKLSASGNGYEGEILAEGDQWLITSIPYDENLEIYADGTRVETAQVNGGFAGAAISAGTQRIEIRYQAPGSRAGLAFSGTAALALCIWKSGCKWKKRRQEHEDLSV